MSQITTDHNTIRRWVEARGGRPAAVKITRADNDPGIVRIDFPGLAGERALHPISWDEFFEKFDERELALVYEDGDGNGRPVRCAKLIRRDSIH